MRADSERLLDILEAIAAIREQVTDKRRFDEDIVLGPDASGRLGLSDGGVYEIALFQAQRQSTSSSLQVTLPPSNAAPSECALR